MCSSQPLRFHDFDAQLDDWKPFRLDKWRPVKRYSCPMARMGKTVNSKLKRLPWNDHVGCYGAHSSSFCKIWRPLDKAKVDTWRDVLLRNEQEEHWRSKHLKKNSSSSWYGPWRHQIIYFESRIERCWGKEESLVQQEYS